MLCEILKKVFIVACNINTNLNVNDYLPKLTTNNEENYNLFWCFAGKCSNTLLYVLYQLGYCQEPRLLTIITEMIEIRKLFEHEEQDVDGCISSFIRQHVNHPIIELLSGKTITLMSNIKVVYVIIFSYFR